MIQNLKIKTRMILSFFLFFLLFCCFTTAFAQVVVKPVKPKRQVINESGKPAEKSLTVDAKVNISLCVTEGNIKVHGWDRNEIRAYISDGGSKVGFKILQKSKQTENPVWVMVVGFDPSETSRIEPEECLSGDEIELDVPRGATVNIKSRESKTTIDSVGKVRVDNIGGDIFLNNISNGIDATTRQGGVTVSRSSGAMVLSTNEGNIVAFDVSPSEIGDFFKAKTSNGTITLQEIEHRQIEANSISGSIKYTGEFLNGGQYNFGTTSGAILLSIPENSSCKITAFYGFGQFTSGFELKNIKQTPTSGAQTISGQIGGGEANLNLKTFSGRIVIRKFN